VRHIRLLKKTHMPIALSIVEGCARPISRHIGRLFCALFSSMFKPISDIRLLISVPCALLLALTVTAEAQQQPAKLPRIGYISESNPAAFRQGLKDLG
jgi:hypothetical protein